MNNKQNAIARLDAIEKEAAELRKIIEAPEKPEGLWRPEAQKRFWYVMGNSETADVSDLSNCYSPNNRMLNRGNCFPSREIAEKAAPLMARANKIIAAALQADPDAGEWADSRRHTASRTFQDWFACYNNSDGCRALAVFVHSFEQAQEMARILNAENIK